MTFLRIYNKRFKRDMWTDDRLSNSASHFCLCTMCRKSSINEGVICRVHESFMRMTEELGIAAPVFACSEFREGKELYNYLDPHFNRDARVFFNTHYGREETDNNKSKRLKVEWEAQKKLWNKGGLTRLYSLARCIE